MKWPFIRHPARVDSRHVHPVHLVFQSTGSSHHVQSGFRHVGVRMAMAFRHARKLTLHGGHVNHELAREWALLQEWF